MYDLVKLVPRAVIRLRTFGMAGRSATRMSSVEMKTMLGRPSATAGVAAAVGCGRDISAAGVASARAAIRHGSHRARTLRRPNDRFPAAGLGAVPMTSSLHRRPHSCGCLDTVQGSIDTSTGTRALGAQAAL